MSTNVSRLRWDQRLFHVVWLWIAFRTMLPWLVTFRLTLEGAGYSWGADYFGHRFHSSGLARPDFLLVYALLAVGILMLALLRRHRFRVAGPLVVAYLAVFAANAMYQLVRGEPVIFRGDTLDVTLNVSIVFFVLQFSMFAVAVLWWVGVRDVDRGTGTPPLGPIRRGLLVVALAVIPAQIVLLVIGEPHALTDEIGVIVTLLNWVLLCAIFYPGAGYRSPIPRGSP